jgi:DNA-binding response OmpR family regulator
VASKKIMIVDDETDFVSLLESRLKGQGYDVIGIDQSHKVVQQVKKENPDLIILDILMPDPDGLELQRLLSQDHSTKHIPVIFVTALKKKEEEGIAGKGSHIIIAKPFDAETLLAEISKILNP